jgi:hypothetical protein
VTFRYLPPRLSLWSSKVDGTQRFTVPRMKSKVSGITPMTVWASPSSIIVAPTMSGSAPNWLRQVVSLNTATGASSRPPSSAANVRPSIGSARSSAKMLGVTCATVICWGRSMPVRLRSENVEAIHASTDEVCACQSKKLAGEARSVSSGSLRLFSYTTIIRSAFGYGSGRSIHEFITLKMVVLAATPSAIETMAMAVTTGVLTIMRKA